MLLILCAPPASGKTFFLKNYVELVSGKKLYLSPLRALKEEVAKNFSHPLLKISTAESFLFESQDDETELLIVDEAHLWWEWGDSFRPLLWESFFKAYNKTQFALFLSATVTYKMREDLEAWGKMGEEIYFLDYGNFKFKFPPTKIYLWRRYGFRSFIEALVLQKSEKTILVFCKYRSEVDVWTQWLKKQNRNVLSCKGGEVVQFSSELSLNSNPEFIVATKVLSHGVNLPVLSHVIFLYEERDPVFWLQMSTRGGRRGERYELHTFYLPKEYRASVFETLGIILRAKIELLKTEWLHGRRRYHPPKISLQRARSHRQSTFTSRFNGELLRLWRTGWRKQTKTF